MRKVTKTKKKKGEGGKNLNPQRQQKCCQPQCCTFNPLVPAFCRQLAKPKAVQQFWALFAGLCEGNNKKCRQLWLLVFLFFLFIFFCWPAKPLPSSSLNLRRRLKWQSFFLYFFCALQERRDIPMPPPWVPFGVLLLWQPLFYIYFFVRLGSP